MEWNIRRNFMSKRIILSKYADEYKNSAYDNIRKAKK